ncbi:MAG: efflux RND transporter periplasmic adaptor subunit [Chloroflexota bacterium]
MNLSSSVIAAGVIVLLGGLMLIWWWTSRPTLSRGLRALLRIVAIPVFIGLVGAGIFLANRSSAVAAGSAARAAVVTPSESMTVKTGTLTVTLNSTGSLTPADNKALTFDVSASVTVVNVAVGDQVKAGDVLVSVDSTAIDSQIQSAQLNLTDAQNALTALQTPPTDLQIEMAKTQIQAAQASLSSASLNGPTDADKEIARLNVELAKNSLWQAQVNRDVTEAKTANQEVNAYSNNVAEAASMASSQAQVDMAQSSYEGTLNEGANASGLASGNASLLSAEANLDSLMSGASEADIRKAQIAVDNAKLSLASAQKNLEKTTLVAPFDGVVAAVDFVKGTLSTGESITLVNTGGYTITLAVDEKDITQLQVGQAVTLSVEALNNASISGTVTRVDPAPVTSTSGQLVTYNVEVTLGATDQPLRPGMSAIATVTLNQISNVIVVPNRFVTVNPTTQEATVKVGTAPNKYEDVPVKLGTRTDSESEVMSGLTVGQTLVILPSGSTATRTQSGLGLLPGAGRAGAGGGGFGGGAGGGFGGGGGGAPPGGG